MNPDWSPVLLDSTPVDQDLEMGEHIRLLIFKSGSGVFTPCYSTVIIVEEGLPPEEFRAALLKGRVLPKKE